MRKFLAIMLVLVFAGLSSAQSSDDQNATIRAVQAEQAQTMRSITALQTRMQADLADLKNDMAEVKAMLVAMNKASANPVVRSTTGGWDPQAAFATMPSQPQMPQMYTSQGYSSMSSAGNCAGGSCGTVAGRGRRGR